MLMVVIFFRYFIEKKSEISKSNEFLYLLVIGKLAYIMLI